MVRSLKNPAVEMRTGPRVDITAATKNEQAATEIFRIDFPNNDIVNLLLPGTWHYSQSLSTSIVFLNYNAYWFILRFLFNWGNSTFVSDEINIRGKRKFESTGQLIVPK
jgi:hypothetical protein